MPVIKKDNKQIDVSEKFMLELFLFGGKPSFT